MHIFDADHPYELNYDKACVKYLEVDGVNKKVRIDLLCCFSLKTEKMDF